MLIQLPATPGSEILEAERAGMEAFRDLISLVYFEVDGRGRVTLLEGEAEELLGSPPQHWLGKRLESLWRGEPLEGSAASLNDRMVTREDTQQRFWLRVSALESGFRGVLLDCSRQEAARPDSDPLLVTLRQQQAQLAEMELASRQRQAFALIFSRELRGLMHRMLGLLATVRQKPQAQSLDALQASLEHLLALSGPLQEALGPNWTVQANAVEFDPRLAVSEVAGWLNSEARAKVIEIHCNFSESIPPRLLGDVVKLRQILLQLLDNAVKFSAGDVIVDVSGDTELRFCVQDTGPGMAPEKLDSLFDGSLLSGELPVAGLGVRLARHLVEVLGGKIWAESQPEAGTSFSFSLPFAETVPPPEAEASSGRLRVLLAEDDAICQKVALRILNSMGHRVDIVSNGLDVLEALQRGTYDVVLLDVEMPGLDGLETARQIHARFVPVPYLIALTAGNSAADRRKVMLSGMHDFLAKPLRAEELADALTQISL